MNAATTKLHNNKYAKPNLELIRHFLCFVLVFVLSTLTTFVQYSTGMYIYSRRSSIALSGSPSRRRKTLISNPPVPPLPCGSSSEGEKTKE